MKNKEISKEGKRERGKGRERAGEWEMSHMGSVMLMVNVDRTPSSRQYTGWPML